MRMVDLILAKRNNREHSKDEIEFIISGIMDGSIPDYQLSAWLMAVCWQGMTIAETAFLTDAMCHSGEVLDLSSIGAIVGDKHSTGGVGDKTTLVFVPLLAAAGIPMAKLSGRGLGHTGGTIDKLEAIPGFRTDIPISEFIAQVKEIGMAIVGQTQDLAPADGKIYALRDVTGTVESIPLIAASIVSKKIAAGSNLIILDVKCGRGAFMETLEQAQTLARTMVEVGKRLKRPVTAVVTDMEQPLGNAVGHTLEVMEAIETLKGRGPDDFRELCLTLGAEALVTAGKAEHEKQAREILEELIHSGKALDNLRKLIIAQGGNPAVIEDPSLMPTAKYQFNFVVPGKGEKYISHLDGRFVAEACKVMGAGRSKKGEQIDLSVGVVLQGKIGARVSGGETIAIVHANSPEQFEAASVKLNEAFTFTDAPVAVPSVIRSCVV
ncbi:MAG: thymidine phosphorylase [Candidatus Obscuribacterales bacterium]|nr:thymidine phosphorylase [Candidatus Obscuribacterales bacterium]